MVPCGLYRSASRHCFELSADTLPRGLRPDVPGSLHLGAGVSRCLRCRPQAGRWHVAGGAFLQPDLNAPGGVRDYIDRYDGLYDNLFKQMQRRVDWTGPLCDAIEAERRERLPVEALQDRQAWRDRRLMALVAHKRRAAKDIGD